MKNKLLLIFLLSFQILKIYSQGFLWAKRESITGGTTEMALDSLGNSYGVVVENQIFKLDSLGNQLWLKQFVGAQIKMVDCDLNGNVYVSGKFVNGTIDFDPEVGVYNLNSINGNYFICKLDFQGSFIWAKQLKAKIFSFDIDNKNNVCLSGGFGSTVDIDPGVGVFNIDSVNGQAYLCKLTGNGDLSWVKQFPFTGQFAGQNINFIKTDINGFIYVKGQLPAPSGTIFDMDPGSNTFNLISPGHFIEKLDSLGNFIWIKPIVASMKSIAIDYMGNVYISGSFMGSVDFDPGVNTYYLTTDAYYYPDLFIEKLDPNGNFKWVKQIGNLSNYEESYGISADKYGNIYTTGYFQNVVDFDPGPGTYNLTGGGFSEIYVNKLDSLGNFKWAVSMNGPGGQTGNDIHLDRNCNIYTIGVFYGPSDFDPSSGVYILSNPITNTVTNSAPLGAYMCKLSNCLSGLSVNSSTTCVGNSVTLSANGVSQYTWSTGATTSSITVLPLAAGIINYTLTAVGFNSCLNTRIISLNVNPTPTITVNSGSICSGSSFTIIPNGAYTYTYSNGIDIITPLSNITVTVIGTDITGCSNIVGAISSITVVTSPTLSVSGTNTVCEGTSTELTASGGSTYLWNTSAITTSISITPTISTTYTVTGTNLNNCSNTKTITVLVNNSCQDVWPGDANSDGITDNLDVLELGLHYSQIGIPRATTSNSWQSYYSDNWIGTITNGQNLNHSDCNGDGTINNDDTLAIYNNYGLIHAFKLTNQTTNNPQLSIAPDQAFVVKGIWGSSSIYLGDTTTPINNINGAAFTVAFDHSLIEPNDIYLEYQNSFIDAGQNLHFRKLDFSNGKIYTATTHTNNTNVNGYGKIATLHYKIKSSLTTDETLNLSITQANQSDASGSITPLTSGTASIMALGVSTGLDDILNTSYISINPNPANGIINIISSTDSEKIEITNVTGQILLSETAHSKVHAVNLESLSNGVYFTRIHLNDSVVVVKKIIIQK